jgi:hypothetical protein
MRISTVGESKPQGFWVALRWTMAGRDYYRSARNLIIDACCLRPLAGSELWIIIGRGIRYPVTTEAVVARRWPTSVTRFTLFTKTQAQALDTRAIPPGGRPRGQAPTSAIAQHHPVAVPVTQGCLGDFPQDAIVEFMAGDLRHRALRPE